MTIGAALKGVADLWICCPAKPALETEPPRLQAQTRRLVQIFAVVGGGGTKSFLRPVTEQLRCGFDDTFAMLEQPFAVAANEVDLVLAAFLVHRPEVVDGVRRRQF